MPGGPGPARIRYGRIAAWPRRDRGPVTRAAMVLETFLAAAPPRTPALILAEAFSWHSPRIGPPDADAGFRG